MVFNELSPPRLDNRDDDYPEHFGDEHRRTLESDQTRGFALFDGESLVSFLWMAVENVPGAINHDGHPATQFPLYLPDGIGYLFDVLVIPMDRGRRLYGAMILQLSSQLSSDGFTGLMLTTEGSHHRALRSVKRMGFQTIGGSMLFGIGGITVAKYPSQPMSRGIQFGRYAGEQRV